MKKKWIVNNKTKLYRMTNNQYPQRAAYLNTGIITAQK